MFDKVLGFICYTFLFGVFHNICRMSSSYFPKCKWKKYIIVRNRILAKILIAESVSRDKLVSQYDSNKMLLVGLISYMTLEPINIYIWITSTMETLNLKSRYIMIICSIWVVIIIFFTIIIAINTSKCGKK